MTQVSGHGWLSDRDGLTAMAQRHLGLRGLGGGADIGLFFALAARSENEGERRERCGWAERAMKTMDLEHDVSPFDDSRFECSACATGVEGTRV